MRRLSDCGSVFNREMSLLDRESLCDVEQSNNPFHSHLNFGKRAVNQTPQSRTTSSRKLGLHASLIGMTHPRTD